jgi:hypothetical protein
VLFRICILTLLAIFGVILLAAQTESTYSRGPIDVKILVPASRAAEDAWIAEQDFRRRIDRVAKEWNRWLEMLSDQEKEQHTVDLKAICKESEQLEKVIKLITDLRSHPASPCTKCSDNVKK